MAVGAKNGVQINVMLEIFDIINEFLCREKRGKKLSFYVGLFEKIHFRIGRGFCEGCNTFSHGF